MTGVALGIVTMRFAAGIFVYLIERYPVLEAAAYLLVLSIGLGLIAEDFLHIRPTDVQRFLISFSILVLTLWYGRSAAFQRLGRRLIWLKRALGYVDLLFIYILKPLSWAVAGLAVLVRAVAQMIPGFRPQAADPAEQALQPKANPGADE